MRFIPVVASLLLLSGCATWSSSNVKAPTHSEMAASAQKQEAVVPTKAADIIVTESDISDRNYEVVGDLDVTVNKTTIFHPDPTEELVAEKLKEEAVKLGADAVVLVRYGTVGVSMMSWGSLDGKGRAVRFVD